MAPLPPGVTSEDLQLFGFWTYEFRVGHAGLWSTAQGRYGRPLRVSGIQHPAPNLICSASRTEQGVAVTAPYATTLLNGRRVFSTGRGDPRTQIWFMLYAQVRQADGTSYRNILLSHVVGVPLDRFTGFAGAPAPAGGNPRAYREFPQEEVTAWLKLLGLAATSSLSVLAVELLPFGEQVYQQLPIGVNGSAAATGAEFQAAEEGNGGDPLGAGLGSRRILRTSPLTALPSVC